MVTLLTHLPAIVWHDLEQDGPPSDYSTVWIHHGQDTVKLAVYVSASETWQDAFKGDVEYHAVVAWAPFSQPSVPTRKVAWSAPIEQEEL